jgi:hypothetical protein
MVRGGLLLVVLAALIGFASPARGAGMPCWQRLVEDWADGRIEASYPVGCYRQALARLPEDLRVYSTAGDDIQAALARKISRAGSGARALAVSPQSIGHAGTGAGFPASAVIVASILGGALIGLVGLPAARARRTRR